MCCDNECLEIIFPTCISPVEGLTCVTGLNLQEQIIAIEALACANLQDTVTVSFGAVECAQYKYEYTLTDPNPLITTGNFILNVDLFAFNDSVTNVFNMTVSNTTTGVILYQGSETTITLPKPSLLQGINVIIQFITNTGTIKTYSDSIVLNNFSLLNHSYIKYMICNTSGFITTSVQAVLQTIINQLQTCC